MVVSGSGAEDRVVIAYRDGSNTYVNSVVGTVSGTSISFGTEVVVSGSGAEEEVGIAYDSNNQKIVIGFTQSDVAKGIVGTVSGTSISYGTAVNFNSGNTALKIRAVYDSNAQKVVFFFRGAASTYYGQAVSGAVSGTSISFGSVTTFQSGRTEEIAAVYDANAQKSVVVYRDYAAGRGDAVVFTTGFTSQNLTSENYIGMSRGVAVQTGSNTSAGTAATFVSGEAIYMNNALTFDSNSNKLVVAFRNSSSGDNGFAAVGTVSGTDISFGTPVAYNSGSSSTNHNTAIFDSNTNRIVIAYQDGGNSSYGTAIVGTVSGTSISFGTEVVFESANTQKIASAFDSNSNKVVIAYADSGNSGHGTAIVGTVDSSDNSISFGSPVVFQSSNSEHISATFDSNSNKVVISYSTGPGNAIVGTVSGTSISGSGS